MYLTLVTLVFWSLQAHRYESYEPILFLLSYSIFEQLLEIFQTNFQITDFTFSSEKYSFFEQLLEFFKHFFKN